MSQGEIRLFNAVLDQLKEATANANKALDAAWRETEKTRVHYARQKRSGQQR
jgi:hypothetical protein